MATLNLLREYELFSSIPDLRYGSETGVYDMAASTHVQSHLTSLKRGLDFLEKIKIFYNENRKG